MQKIWKSVFILFLVTALGISATGAYFSDRETSRDNTFTAGAIDLTVDSEAHYNGLICDGEVWTCEPWASSVISSNQGLRKNGTPVLPDRSDPTAALGSAESNGDDYDSPVIPGSFYSLGFGGSVVLSFANPIYDGGGDDLIIYEVTGGSSYPDEKVEVEVSQDNLNWTMLGIAVRDESFDISSVYPWIKYVRITDISDLNLFNSTADGFDLDAVEALHCSSLADLIDQPCNNSWELTDLGPTHKFFDFDDIKPGDWGENTISLHIENNPAYGCLIFSSLQDDDLGLTEPESEVDDSDGEDEGELAENLHFFMWMDDGDNVWEEGEEVITGPVSAEEGLDNISYELATPSSEPLSAGQTSYIGIAWCAGTIMVDIEGYTISCDASGMGNEAQTDSMSVDVSFYVEQVRHNDQFACPVPTV